MARCCNLIRLALVLLIVATLAGCRDWPNAQEARVCRTIAPAINPPGTTIDVRHTAQLPEGRGIAVRYSAQAPNGPVRHRQLVCRFADDDFGPGDRLAEVWSDGERLGDIRLVFLKRFWLGSSDAAAADPAPYLLLGRLPEVPMGMAVGLQHLLSALPQISVYLMLAPAFALVYGLIGRINLAFGEFAALGGYGALVAFPLASWLGSWPAVLAISLVLGVFAASIHGLAAERLVFRPLHRARGQQVLIATVGLAIALQEYMRLTQGSALRWVSPFLNNPVGLAQSDAFIVTVTPISLAVSGFALVTALGLLALMRWTRFGRSWRACADDPLAAKMFGVNFNRILASTFILASALAGLTGTIITFYYGGVGYAGGIVLGLKALIAAIVGGIGSISGAFLGAVLVGGAEALWSALFPIEYRDLAIFGLLAAFLIWRPGGLLGHGNELPRQSQ